MPACMGFAAPARHGIVMPPVRGLMSPLESHFS
jgi:hypothetical protein